MLQLRELIRIISLINIKTEQNLLNPLPLKLELKVQSKRHRLFTQTKIPILTIKEQITARIDIKVENSIPRILKE